MDPIDGYVVTPGVPISTLSPQPADLPLGLAFTTGIFTAKDASPVVVTHTTSGSDTRTPAGSGMVQLVAGGVTHSASQGPFQNFFRISMTIPEPGATAGLAAGLVFLFGLARLHGRQK